MRKELHSIKKFRVGNLGIIRLNCLAYPRNITVKLGDKEFKPVGYDTYGHPVISEENFTYYKALKAIKERQGESLVPEVEYEHEPFVVKRSVYDSAEGISKFETVTIEEGSFETDTVEEKMLKTLKNTLICRKRANFAHKPLNTFILFGKYALYEDGHVYMCTFSLKDQTVYHKSVLELSEVENFELLEEVHIPGHEDTCFICGKRFNINDIRNVGTTEDPKCRKVHKKCLSEYIEAVNYQKASKIIDSVYQDYSESEIVREYDEEDRKEKVWYVYHTKQGDVALRFKNKVIEIKWFGNFKPFKLETLFADEEVTKRRLEDAKVIHAWDTDDAIRYLSMVKKH